MWSTLVCLCIPENFASTLAKNEVRRKANLCFLTFGVLCLFFCVDGIKENNCIGTFFYIHLKCTSDLWLPLSAYHRLLLNSHIIFIFLKALLNVPEKPKSRSHTMKSTMRVSSIGDKEVIR